MIANQIFRKFTLIGMALLAIMILFATPTTVMAQTDGDGDKLVLGGRFRLHDGETIQGNLIVVGGTAILDEGSLVNGDVFLTGGTVEVAGTVAGDITSLGGTVHLLGDSVVEGDVNLSSATFTTSNFAEIRGEIHNSVFSLDELQFGQVPPNVVTQPDITSPYRAWIDFLTGLLWTGLRILAVAGLAALVVLIAQKQTERVALSIASQPVIASAFGLLTAIVTPALLVVLTITILLIPVALVGLLLLSLAGLFGWIAIGYELGKRVEKGLKQNWAPAITAGAGNFLLGLTASLFGIIPCIGWIIPVVISIVGLGGVLISRFGSQVYGPPDHDGALRPDGIVEVKENPPSSPNKGQEPGPTSFEIR